MHAAECPFLYYCGRAEVMGRGHKQVHNRIPWLHFSQTRGEYNLEVQTLLLDSPPEGSSLSNQKSLVALTTSFPHGAGSLLLIIGISCYSCQATKSIVIGSIHGKMAAMVPKSSCPYFFSMNNMNLYTFSFLQGHAL